MMRRPEGLSKREDPLQTPGQDLVLSGTAQRQPFCPLPGRGGVRRGAWLLLGLLSLLSACAQAPKLELRAPVVLLGEVHDNAAQHRLRLEAFKALLATGARPALLMEQFDRSQQTIIDSQRQGTADSLINAAKTGSGWQWDFYRPFIALALAHGLPIIAANVSREIGRASCRERV